MTAGAGHPTLLPWFVSGKLDAEAAADVARHLTQCEECRGEAAALASMKETMRRHARTDHVPIPDLVEYEEGATTGASGAAASIAAHLEVCATCSEDLAVLRAARLDLDRDEATTRARRSRNVVPSSGMRRLGILAAAAAVVVLVAPLVVRLTSRREPPAMTGLDLVTFSPTARGGTGRPELHGDGPWAVSVLLPLMATPGTYIVSVQSPDGTGIPGLELRTVSRGDGRLTFLLPALPGPGAYRLRVRGEDGTGAEPVDYAFDYSAGKPEP